MQEQHKTLILELQNKQMKPGFQTDFMESMNKRVENGWDLTDKQAKVLENLHDEHCGKVQAPTKPSGGKVQAKLSSTEQTRLYLEDREMKLIICGLGKFAFDEVTKDVDYADSHLDDEPPTEDEIIALANNLMRDFQTQRKISLGRNEPCEFLSDIPSWYRRMQRQEELSK